MDISAILDVLAHRGFKIGTVNTEEPTLEEVFMHLTRQNK
jgi:acetolactate synthase regulatory subunit